MWPLVTYLYYTKTIGSQNWPRVKIADEALDVIGMAYANGEYIVAYNKDSKLHFWKCKDITAKPLASYHITNGTSAGSLLAQSTNVICAVSGANAVKWTY